MFGDRKKHGIKVDEHDEEWGMWLEQYNNLINTQTQGIGKFINNSGYKILKNIDFRNKTVLEIGPGSMNHLDIMPNYPKEYIGGDRSEIFRSQ